jgi:hypothetical protein
VIDADGRPAGIISRADVLSVFDRPGHRNPLLARSSFPLD